MFNTRLLIILNNYKKVDLTEKLKNHNVILIAFDE